MADEVHNTPVEKPEIILFAGKADPESFDSTLSKIPLALLSISSFLAQDHRIAIIAATSKYDYKQKVLDLITDKTICVGITAMTGFQIHDGLEISRMVKEKYPNIPIIWGGWHPSICPKQTIENRYIDVVVRGQGQRTFAEIVHALEKKGSLSSILGIHYKENGVIKENSDRPFEDINNFPPLPFHLLDLNEYINSTEMGSRTIAYISSQGCPHRCDFCVERRVNKSRWSGLKAERVLDDFEYLVKKHGVNAIELADSNFFTNKLRVKQICEGIIERKLDIKWGNANGRAEQLITFEESLWELMKKSGCYGILIGAESGYQKVLDMIHKDGTVEDILEFTKLAKKYGLKVTYSFMTGFPLAVLSEDESDLEIEKTIDLIEQINEIKSTDNTIFLCIYSPYPGTPLYEVDLKNGFKEPLELDGWSCMNHGIKKTWMSEKNYKLVRQLNDYVLPFISDDFQKRHNSRFKLLNRIFHSMASARWKNKMFSFPVDYSLFKTLRTINRKVNAARQT